MSAEDTSGEEAEELPPEDLPPFPDIAPPEGITDASALSDTSVNMVCKEFCVYLRGRPWKTHHWCAPTIEELNELIRNYLVSLYNQGFGPVEANEGRCPGG